MSALRPPGHHGQRGSWTTSRTDAVVIHCNADCATHNCARLCGRVDGHPVDDDWGCVCAACAWLMSGAP